MDKNTTQPQPKKALAISRETVRALRVRSNVRTGICKPGDSCGCPPQNQTVFCDTLCC